MNTDPRTDPAQIRAEVDQILAELPDDGTDIDAAGRRLEQAHQILVDALESVEKG
jgi:hypothetical protein